MAYRYRARMYQYIWRVAIEGYGKKNTKTEQPQYILVAFTLMLDKLYTPFNCSQSDENYLQLLLQSSAYIQNGNVSSPLYWPFRLVTVTVDLTTVQLLFIRFIVY